VNFPLFLVFRPKLGPNDSRNGVFQAVAQRRPPSGAAALLVLQLASESIGGQCHALARAGEGEIDGGEHDVDFSMMPKIVACSRRSEPLEVDMCFDVDAVRRLLARLRARTHQQRRGHARLLLSAAFVRVEGACRTCASRRRLRS